MASQMKEMICNMANEEINDWRYPPVPKAIQEALKDYPELIAEIQKWFSNVDKRYAMSNTMSLRQRVDRLHRVTDSLKDGLMCFSSQARTKLEAAQAIGDTAAIAAAQAEREAVTQAIIINNRSNSWDEFIDFYGLVWPNDGTGARIKEGA